MKRLALLPPLAMLASALPLAARPAQPAADPVRGARLFLQCQACHSLAKGQPAKLGPNLAGIIGAKAASRPDYAYSAALAKSALVWDDATLDRWLARPADVVAGTKMVFAGVPRPEDRQALIAYLRQRTR